MRGTLFLCFPSEQACRIIPAHAGNSVSRSIWTVYSADHPRACGGTQEMAKRILDVTRIIPAHAGNSHDDPLSVSHVPDHPRACGELDRLGYQLAEEFGSSPRMRGTPGTQTRSASLCRIIPAHAGNSSFSSQRSLLHSDHPRACGELVASRENWYRLFGSSPRMRGTRLSGEHPLLSSRIIPAHAGNSCQPPTAALPRADHPRACGELSRYTISLQACSGSSPRMRGTHLFRLGL